MRDSEEGLEVDAIAADLALRREMLAIINAKIATIESCGGAAAEVIPFLAELRAARDRLATQIALSDPARRPSADEPLAN